MPVLAGRAAAVRVRIRTYCQGCRYGTRSAMPLGQRRNADGPAEDRAFCVWRAHRYQWEYFITCAGIRLRQRRDLVSLDAALVSAREQWAVLEAIVAELQG
jgi:hypothetical protein